MSSPVPAHGPSDADLIERCRRGENAAWDLLYRTYFRKVRHVLEVFLHRQACVDECCQLVFLNAYKSIGTFKTGEDRVKPWLAAIARNVARDHLRRLKRRPSETVGGDEMPIEHFADPATGNRWVERPYSDPEVRCLATLSLFERGLLMMFHVDKLSAKEIEAEVQKAPGTIYVALGRARAKLKACIEKKRGL